jgi:hypothetical protein
MIKFRTLAFLALAVCYNLSFSATWTWVGGTSTDWDLKANWSTSSSSSRPQSGDDVIINAGAVRQPQMTDARTIANLAINGGILDVGSYTLTVSNKITANGGSFTNANDNSTGDIKTDDMEINTSGVVSLSSIGTLLLTVSGTLTFTNGIIESTSDDIVIIKDNATVANASDASHVDGPVRKIGNDAFTFPIGNGTVYAPLGISDFSSTSTGQYSTAQYSSTAPTGLLNGGGTLSNTETWSLVKSNILHLSKITVSYNANQRSGGIMDSSDLAVAVNTGIIWLPINSLALGSNTIGSLTTSTRVSGLISGITISSPSGLNALPIELMDFSAKKAANQVDINWSTVSETNNDFFTVEKSIDGKNWSAISKLEGAMNSNTVLNYQSADNAPVNGMQYYRLKQTDLNGKVSYSAIVAVNYNHVASNKVSLYPNPVKNVLNIQLNTEASEQVTIVLTNAMGQKVMEMNNVSGASFTMDVAALENGVYFLEVAQESGITKTKIVKN